MSLSSPRLSVRGVSKTFGSARVLSGLDLEIDGGEVHALVGHNGSGKSTFVKLLAGYHQPDPGAQASVDGEPFTLGSDRAAEAAGLRFVHQDLGLIETLDAVDNVLLGSPYPLRRGGRIDWNAARDETTKLLASLGFDFPPTWRVARLSPTQRTGVCIARALRARAMPTRVVVLDEPTAALPAREVTTLFQVIRALQERGLGVLYISHHLEEVLALADRITVLRDGRQVATAAATQLDEARLVELMVGEGAGEHRMPRRVRSGPGEPILQVSDLRTGSLAGITFAVRVGEIVGVAGLDGSGRDDLAPAVFGGIPRSGEVRLHGEALPPLRPDVAVRRGAGFVPADRGREAALHRMSVGENLTISDVPTRLHGLLLDRGRERGEASGWAGRLAIVAPRPESPIDTLSGGNQQKVIIARWLRTEPSMLILDEPTKGVDVAAVADIWRLIEAAALAGTAVLVCSSDAEEIATHCDRVLVLRHGQIADQLAGEALNAETLDALTLTDRPGELAWAR